MKTYIENGCKRAAVINFDVDFIFKLKEQADHLAKKLIEDGRFEFTWTQELTTTHEQWRINVCGPWANNLKWMAIAAAEVDADLLDTDQ